jgi:bla regulator protein BlaR1
VWWIGARLVDEREQACDEDVIRLGGNRQVYAETILMACRSSMEPPPVCMARVGASELAKRLERIMNSVPVPVSRWKVYLLAAAAIATIGVPPAAALVEPPPAPHASPPQSAARGPAFASATITRSTTDDAPSGLANRPGGFELRGVTLGRVIANAWRLHHFQISGAPDWFATDRFDIVATASGNPPMREKWLMVRTLLADHFKLRVHTESRPRPMYDLVMARAHRRPGRSFADPPRRAACQAPCRAVISASRSLAS